MFGGKHDGLRIETAVLIKPRSQNRDTENNLAEFGAPEETGWLRSVSLGGRIKTEIVHPSGESQESR